MPPLTQILKLALMRVRVGVIFRIFSQLPSRQGRGVNFLIGRLICVEDHCIRSDKRGP
jgi:hypothetical protein